MMLVELKERLCRLGVLVLLIVALTVFLLLVREFSLSGVLALLSLFWTTVAIYRKVLRRRNRGRIKSDNEESDPLIYEQWPGKNVLNKTVLRETLRGVGLTMIDASSVPLSKLFCTKHTDVPKKAVYYLTRIQLALLFEEEVINYPSDYLAGLLPNCNCEAFGKPVAIFPTFTRRTIVQRLKHFRQCAVCFAEESEDSKALKDWHYDCDCGATLCFACFIDLFLTDEKCAKSRTKDCSELTHKCPICRKIGGPLTSWTVIVGLILKKRRTLRGVTQKQVDFVERVTSIELDNDRWPTARSEAELFAFMSDLFSKHCIKSAEDCNSEMEVEIFKEIRDFVAEFRRSKRSEKKKKVAEKRTTVKENGFVELPMDCGCANCGKSFWDKSERKRAPKCPKCKETAYCNTKCRKKHRKAHSYECTALTSKKKTKAKKKARM